MARRRTREVALEPPQPQREGRAVRHQLRGAGLGGDERLLGRVAASSVTSSAGASAGSMAWRWARASPSCPATRSPMPSACTSRSTRRRHRLAVDARREEERAAHVGRVGARGVDVRHGHAVPLGQVPDRGLGGDGVDLDVAGGEDGGHEAQRRAVVVGVEQHVAAPGARRGGHQVRRHDRPLEACRDRNGPGPCRARPPAAAPLLTRPPTRRGRAWRWRGRHGRQRRAPPTPPVRSRRRHRRAAWPPARR